MAAVTDFPDNSFATRKVKPNTNPLGLEETVERTPVEPVVKGTVTVKKKSEVKKILGLFLPQDVSNMRGYILEDVIVPAIKNGILDIISLLFWGRRYGSKGAGSVFSRNGTVYRDFTDYGAAYRGFSQSSNQHNAKPVVSSAAYDVDEMIVTDPSEANDVVKALQDRIADYGIVTVAEYFQMLRLEAPWTMRNWCWTNLDAADIIRVQDGYLIKLPKPSPMN